MDPYTAEQILLESDIDTIHSLCQTDQNFNQVCHSQTFWERLFKRDNLEFHPQPSSYQYYVDEYLDQVELRNETRFWLNYLYFAYLFTPHDRPQIGLRTKYSPELIDLGPDHEYLDLLYNYHRGTAGFLVHVSDQQYNLSYNQMYDLMSNILIKEYPLIDEDDMDLTEILDPKLF